MLHLFNQLKALINKSGLFVQKRWDVELHYILLCDCTGKQLRDSHIALGNKLLVYISSCLAGRAYPLSGDVPAEDNQRVRHDVFKCVTCLHSKNASESEQSYPYLR